ncbi:MAG TPA: 50S ribosomal protein L11 methyltransferase [Thermoleophilaceae bacterium]|nr:50S ribosomal protein L11 methyltransferase [Thermoleophilaceae bacterium]
MIRLSFRAPPESAEQVLAALLELAPGGVEQVDGDGFVEYAVYGAPGELPSFPSGSADVGGVLVQVSGEPVADDWAERWKQFHEPVLVGDRVFVRPPWAAPRPGTLDIVVDPGRAFGTGAHPTTRLSLELLLDLAPGGSFADLGCGSGVLAIAAAKLGFGPVAAVDNEEAALEATRVNAAANGVSLERVERHDLRTEHPPAAETVAANLMRALLLRLAELMEEKPRALILSGLLDEEAGEVVAAFAPLGERRRVSSQSWSALLLAR